MEEPVAQEKVLFPPHSWFLAGSPPTFGLAAPYISLLRILPPSFPPLPVDYLQVGRKLFFAPRLWLSHRK